MATARSPTSPKRPASRDEAGPATRSPFDYDGDGSLDLFVTSMFGRCQLYRNNGNGTFTDVTLKVLGRTPWGAVGRPGLRLQQRWPARPVCRRYALRHVDGPGLGPPLPGTGPEEWEKSKFPSLYGPIGLPDAEARRTRKGTGRDRSTIEHEEVLFGNACYRNDGGGKFTEVSDQAGLENVLALGHRHRAISTTTASRTSSSPRVWAFPLLLAELAC